MKLRAFTVFAIATLLPSSATAQVSRCFRVEWNYLGSSRGAEEISESIAEILVENLPEAWSCENNPDANLWLLYGVTVGYVDSPDQGRRRFDAYLSAHFWPRPLEPTRAFGNQWGPSVILVVKRRTSVREVAEEFELLIRREHRVALEE